MKVAIKTLGCKVNTYESNAIWELFRKKNYQLVDINQIADVYIINTCTVTNNGDRKSRQAIRKMIRLNPDAIVAVVGCYSQINPNEASKIDGVDIVLGTQKREKIVELVEEFYQQRKPILHVDNIMKQKQFENLDVTSFENNTRAFIKIQEGCDNFCTFCIIPWARGLLRSQKPQIILKQVNDLVNDGVKEIVLTGIHTGGYGDDLENYSFAKLLLDLEKITELKRIRISSIEISQIDQEVLRALKKSTKIVNHLHIPIQAATDQILKSMRRHYRINEFKNKVNELREIFPQIALTTDIIVGFPGESEQLFKQGFEVVKEIGFSEIHVFPYSMRSGTPASKMDNQISEPIKKKRVQQMLKLNRCLANNYAQNFNGQIVEVLIEKKNKNNKLEGYTSNYLKIEFLGDVQLIKQIVNVEIVISGYPYSQAKLIK